MKTIYIIGFMGSGKTTIGKNLSEKLAYPVFDTDEEITIIKGKSITKIFEQDGEISFRDFELNILKSLPTNDAIVTTGGGIVLRQENRLWMKENGFVVFLEASDEEIYKRLENDQSRPLLKGDKKAKISTILKERIPLYLDAAHTTIETTGKTIDVIVMEIVERLKNL